MNVVYKYPIPIDDTFSLQLPAGAEVLHVGVQNGQAFIWAMINTNAGLIEQRFVLAGTGHSLDDRLDAGHKFVGTFFVGPFVWHLWRHP